MHGPDTHGQKAGGAGEKQAAIDAARKAEVERAGVEIRRGTRVGVAAAGATGAGAGATGPTTYPPPRGPSQPRAAT